MNKSEISPNKIWPLYLVVVIVQMINVYRRFDHIRNRTPISFVKYHDRLNTIRTIHNQLWCSNYLGRQLNAD